MASKFYLPGKILSYLKRLQTEYRRDDQVNLLEILEAGKIFVLEGVENWNGDGHAVKIFLPENIFDDIALAQEEKFCEKLKDDLNNLARAVQGEWVQSVTFELENEDDQECQQAVLLSKKKPVNPDDLNIWQAGQIRVFISHRDEHKVAARQLGDALSTYGISSFVAHDTITPMSQWQSEILKALETMEVMLAFITDDFDKSTWTNQEIGFAVGRNIPVIPIKAEKDDPSGFISHLQALKINIERPSAAAVDVYKLISKHLSTGGRLRATLIDAFINSPNFIETKERFILMEAAVNSLTDPELKKIVDGFSSNDQLHNCGHLTSQYDRMIKFLKKATGKNFTISGKALAVRD